MLTTRDATEEKEGAIHHTLNYKQLVASSMDITPDKTTAAKSFLTEAVLKNNAEKLSEELKEGQAGDVFRCVISPEACDSPVATPLPAPSPRVKPSSHPSLTLHPHLVHDFSKPPPFSCSQSWHEIAGCLP
ncbi:hypothetical protein JOQ06_010964, partial [Pogonophryne albipinna]